LINASCIVKGNISAAWWQVPDFDIVTRTIAMPNYIVGGIRKSLEQPQRSSSWSSGHSPRANSEVWHHLANSLNTISLFCFACSS
jgi:mitogen-activated protein kinase kinase kinase 1